MDRERTLPQDHPIEAETVAQLAKSGGEERLLVDRVEASQPSKWLAGLTRSVV